MALQLAVFLIGLEIEHSYLSVFVGNDNILVALVKHCAIGGTKTRVELAGFFNHTDVPNLINTITVTWNDHISPLVEFDRVNSIVMSIERLDAQIGSDIPKGHSLVTCSWDEHARVWLPLDRVYWVNMTSEGKPALFWICEVPQFDWMVHWARDQEIAAVMEINFPNWLTMLRVGRLTLSVDEVPKFHTAVTRSGGQ